MDVPAKAFLLGLCLLLGCCMLVFAKDPRLGAEPPSGTRLHNVYDPVAKEWTDIWIDRKNGHEYAEVKKLDGSRKFIYIKPYKPKE